MLAVSENFELFVDDVKIVDLEHRDKEYEVFVYKDLESNEIQVFYVPDAHKEEDEDFARFEFKGSIIVPADLVLELQSKKIQLLSHLYEKVNGIYSYLLSGYSALEKESWEKQEAEARALLSVQTPTIDTLCAVRGCSRDELAKKIVYNADTAKNAGLSILAWQQGIEKNIKEMSLNDFSTIWENITGKQI
jgi:hypothetical protein